MSDKELHEALQVAIKATRSAGLQLMPYYGNVEAQSKGDGCSGAGVVTELDRKTEHFLEAELSKYSKDIGFRGEEYGVRSKADTTWLVDPIDGTEHFIRGIPFCTTMVSLVCDGDVVVSVVHNFVNNITYWAVKGGGAFCNGKEIHVSERPLKKAFVSFETNLNKPENLAKFLALRQQTVILATINCGFEFAMIASGKLDARIGLDPYGEDWDFAPGSLLVAEAGGIIANIGKSSYNYQNHDFIIANQVVYKELTHGNNALFPLNK
jgi:fructose-1,6-bisphosphatase/inositol monophosphatase family enzyme